MKKIIALILCLISAVTLFCACTPKDNVNSSSKVAEVESSVTESEDIKSETSSKDFSETKTSSITDKENKSSKEEKESSKKQESEKESSKEEKPIDRNPSATSTSSGIKLNLPDIEGSTMEIGCFQFAPQYTRDYRDKYEAVNLGDANIDANLEQFEDTIAEGYFNTVMLTTTDFAHEGVWQVLEKYKMKVWFLTAGCYDSSSGKTVDKFFEDTWLKTINFIKDNPKRWEMFNGFAYDELIHRGVSTEDFIATTEYVYKKLGKRNFPVMAPQEFTNLWPVADHGKMTNAACKYVTDIAFDMYSGDVRTDKGNNVANYAKDVYPEYNIKNDKDVYKMMTSEMLKMVGRPVTTWFYPSSHMMGDYHTEEYCLAQLKFFEGLLKEQEHPGGIILFTYAQPNETLYSLQSFLDLGENAKKSFRRYEKLTWYQYSAYLKQLTMRYRLTQNNPTINLGV